MEQIVTGCDNCPLKASHFDGWGGQHCNHPETEVDDTEMKDNSIPELCPLKKESITICISNK